MRLAEPDSTEQSATRRQVRLRRWDPAELTGVPHPPESYQRIEETAEHRRHIDDQRRRDTTHHDRDH